MARNRNEPDPLEIKRRKLAEQEQLLAEQMSRLTDELHNSGVPVPEEVKPAEPPVWRLEDEHHAHRPAESSSARRHLARQRQRDMILFLVFGAILLVVLYFVVWAAYAHSAE